MERNKDNMCTKCNLKCRTITKLLQDACCVSVQDVLQKLPVQEVASPKDEADEGEWPSDTDSSDTDSSVEDVGNQPTSSKKVLNFKCPVIQCKFRAINAMALKAHNEKEHMKETSESKPGTKVQMKYLVAPLHKREEFQSWDDVFGSGSSSD